jgi:hypothetical protein
MPAAVDLSTRRKELGQLPLGHLTLVGPIFRRGGQMYIRARCSACGRQREYVVSNFLSGRTRDCRCQRSLKYARNPLAKIFGHRYDAIRQRCRKGKVKCRFARREEFIRYLLQVVAEKHPEIKTAKTLAHYEIERIRFSGHFQAGNLRLVRPGKKISVKNAGTKFAESANPERRRRAKNPRSLQTGLGKKDVCASGVFVRANRFR